MWFLIYEHKVPCTFWVNGREHLLELNEEIGCFFKDEVAKVDRTELFESIGGWMAESKQKLKQSFRPAGQASSTSDTVPSTST